MPFRFIKSFKVATFFFLAIVAVFLLRLLYLQVVVSGEYAANASEVRTINFTNTAHRGTIYDRNGSVLAISVDAISIYCNPVEVTNIDYEAGKIADVLDGEKEDYAKILGSEGRTFIYIERQADVVKADQLKKLALDGVYFLKDSRREYPNGSVGGQVIGACDVNGNGLCGLELQYDEILKGKNGIYSAERGEDGTPIPGGVHEDVAATDGEDIIISLDINLQGIVEQAVEKGIERNGKNKKGSAVVMDSENGDIYAICSYPYLDPTDLANSYIGSDRLTPIVQSFEPGSVFKSFTALSVLSKGALSPESTLYVPKELEADEYTITDAHEREASVMSFSQILDVSSNVGISLAVDTVGFEDLYSILKSFKISESTGVDFPGEDAGTLHNVSQWSKVGGYNIAFGQGLTSTPLQITRAYSAIANDGIMVKPHFLINKPQSDGWIDYETEQVITDTESLKTLRKMLRGVVTSGTGKSADIPGYDVVGKTSTAQIAEAGGYAENKWNLCFAGFIDNSSSSLVAFVGASEVEYEGNMSSTFHDIMTEAIDLYRIVPE